LPGWLPSPNAARAKAGIRRAWQIPDDLFLEPADEDELRAAEGAGTDALGRSRRRR